MKCGKVREFLPGYLDGALPEERGRISRGSIHAHLSSCGACREELSRYQKLQQLLGRAERVEPPADLAIKIRVAQARERENADARSWFRRLMDRADLVRANVLAPLAVPASGGLVAAMLVFVAVLQFYRSAAPLQLIDGMSDDLPSTLLEPARLEKLANFSVSGLGESSSRSGVMLVEANVGVDGDVLSYRILAGADTPEVRRRLDNILIFSHFSPQKSFGRPIAGGRVLLSFNNVDVQG